MSQLVLGFLIGFAVGLPSVLLALFLPRILKP